MILSKMQKETFLPVHWWQFCLHVHLTVSRKEPNINFSYRKKDLMLGRLKGCWNGRVTLFIESDIIFLRKSQQWVVKSERSVFESFHYTFFCSKIFGKLFALFAVEKENDESSKLIIVLYMMWKSHNVVIEFWPQIIRRAKIVLRGLEQKTKNNNWLLSVGISNLYCVNDSFVKHYKACWLLLHVTFTIVYNITYLDSNWWL